MKNSIKMMWILALGAGLFTMSSCSEDEGNDPEPDPKETVCYPIKVESDDDVYEYTYNDANLVIESKYTYEENVDVNTYSYTDGKLTGAATVWGNAEFIYTGNSAFPNRINVTDEEGPSEFYIIETDADDNLTKVEYHYYEDGQAYLDYVDNFTYVNGELSTYKSEEYDEETEEFTTELELRNFVFDGKKNPYGSQLALAFEEDFNPLFATKSNITAATLVAEDGMGGEIELPYTVTYTYNENDYPLSAESALFRETTSTTITYNCK